MLQPAWQEICLWPDARGLNLPVRRRVVWPAVPGAMGLLPTVSVLVFLASEVLSRASYWMMPP
jgi:hypothetical protein